ncbi:MAG: nickel-dependent lactate racemase [Victivallaceae bacterium]|nr:nickel-dependent lactate racemase [Victivallaceae bacterium]
MCEESIPIEIPYGKTKLSCRLAAKNLVGIFTASLPLPAADPVRETSDALDHPIGSAPLEELARNVQSACVIASDHTRPVPSRILMPQILARLRKYNPAIDVTILIATGCHRPPTQAELIQKFGEKIVRREKIVIHDAFNSAELEEAGTLPSGGKLILNKAALHTDLLVSEGFIEPHFFAGFSGGRKSVLPGVASRVTVLANHCSEFIASANARTGNLEGNPIAEDMLYAADKAKLAFILNVVIDGEKRIVRAFAGAHRAAHEAGCQFLGELARITVPEVDIAITGNGGFPLDQNVYQAVKGMTAREAVTRDGGVIILAASCCDGHGGESFFRRMSEAASPRALLDEIAKIPRDETVPDQWEYQILARILDKHTVIVVTTQCDHALLHSMKLEAASSLDEALCLARAHVGEDAKIAVIPDGVSVIAGKKKHRIDLHTHSCRSDGTDTPRELIEHAAAAELAAIALTDHDTVEGIEEFLSAAGGHPELEAVPGVELSCRYGAREMHLVGLYIDHHNPELLAFLEKMRTERNLRNERIRLKLEALGYPITQEELQAAAGGAAIGRPHFAKILVERDYFANVRAVFEKLLKRGCPAYAPRELPPPEKAIEVIHQAGGIAVWAHPIYRCRNERAWAKRILKHFVPAGLDAVESYYSLFGREETQIMSSLAEEFQILESGGSDYHGGIRPDFALGSGAGGLWVPEQLLAKLKTKVGELRHEPKIPV